MLSMSPIMYHEHGMKILLDKHYGLDFLCFKYLLLLLLLLILVTKVGWAIGKRVREMFSLCQTMLMLGEKGGHVLMSPQELWWGQGECPGGITQVVGR